MSLQRPTFSTDPWAEHVRESYRQEFEDMTDRCRTCGEPEHVTFPDCDSCKGSGHRIGGDEQRPCARCRLRGRDTGRAPFVARAMAGTLAPKVLA